MNIKNGFIILIMAIMVSGCSQNDATKQYYKSAREFNNIYFEVVECVDLANPMKSLELLQIEGNIKSIERLGALLEDIKQNMPKNKERLFDDFKNRYEDLVFLKESYPKFKSLNKDERGRIDLIFTLIGKNKANWNDKKSTRVWE